MLNSQHASTRLWNVLNTIGHVELLDPDISQDEYDREVAALREIREWIEANGDCRPSPKTLADLLDRRAELDARIDKIMRGAAVNNDAGEAAAFVAFTHGGRVYFSPFWSGESAMPRAFLAIDAGSVKLEG